MKILELFSGTHSVGKVSKELGWEVVSLDLKNADINCDVMSWDYKAAFKPREFDVIWASPPCEKFSRLRRSWIGRKIKQFGDEVITGEMLDKDMIENGLPILRKTEEIISYFKPKCFFIENPLSGKMREFINDKPFYDVDYCRYGTGNQKPTRIWTNLTGFKAKRCCKLCGNLKNGIHIANVGGRNSENSKVVKGLNNKHRIPPLLIKELFTTALSSVLFEKTEFLYDNPQFFKYRLIL